MTDVVLDAERHFEALRGPVWARFRSRHAAFDRDRFEDAYAEWWTRELERERAGRPSRAVAPVAFVAEAVHRVVIDDARARARGLARGEKGALQFSELEALAARAAPDDTAEQARYEALAHRVLEVVRDRLTARELQVFVCSYLYLQSTESTARMLDLTPPRVKKDRVKVAARVGDDVWRLLAGELDVCGAQREDRLPPVFEALVDHVEDCEDCARSFGDLRSGALAVVGPFELLLLAPSGHSFLDALHARLVELFDRWSGLATAMPTTGRGTAAVAVAAVAVAGGGAAAGVGAAGEGERSARDVGVAAQATPAVSSQAAAAPVRASSVGDATTDPERERKPRESKPRAHRPASTSSRGGASDGGGSIAPAPMQVTAAPSVDEAPPPPDPSGEFAFERR